MRSVRIRRATGSSAASGAPGARESVGVMRARYRVLPRDANCAGAFSGRGASAPVAVRSPARGGALVASRGRDLVPRLGRPRPAPLSRGAPMPSRPTAPLPAGPVGPPGEPPPRTIAGFHPNVVALGLTSFFTDVSTEMLIPVMPLFITATLGASVASLGLIEGIAECTASALRLVSGRVSDAIRRRKPFLIAGYGGSGVWQTGVALAGPGAPPLGLRRAARLRPRLRRDRAAEAVLDRRLRRLRRVQDVHGARRLVARHARTALRRPGREGAAQSAARRAHRGLDRGRRPGPRVRPPPCHGHVRRGARAARGVVAPRPLVRARRRGLSPHLPGLGAPRRARGRGARAARARAAAQAPHRGGGTRRPRAARAPLRALRLRRRALPARQLEHRVPAAPRAARGLERGRRGAPLPRVQPRLGVVVAPARTALRPGRPPAPAARGLPRIRGELRRGRVLADADRRRGRVPGARRPQRAHRGPGAQPHYRSRAARPAGHRVRHLPRRRGRGAPAREPRRRRALGARRPAGAVRVRGHARARGRDRVRDAPARASRTNRAPCLSRASSLASRRSSPGCREARASWWGPGTMRRCSARARATTSWRARTRSSRAGTSAASSSRPWRSACGSPPRTSRTWRRWRPSRAWGCG